MERGATMMFAPLSILIYYPKIPLLHRTFDDLKYEMIKYQSIRLTEELFTDETSNSIIFRTSAQARTLINCHIFIISCITRHFYTFFI